MTKKSFIDENNPALQFISQDSVDAVENHEGIGTETLGKISTSKKPPKGYKIDPRFIETKTKKVLLVLQPSLYQKVKAASIEAGLSFNEYVHRLLDANVSNQSTNGV